MIGLKQTNIKALWRNRLVRSVSISKVWSSFPGICGVFGKNTKIPLSTKILFEINVRNFDLAISKLSFV